MKNVVALFVCFGLVALLVPVNVMAATEQEKQQAIDDGLAWLADGQNATTGHWEFGDARSDLAATASAALAFIEEDYLPYDASAYGTNVGKAVDYILNGAQVVSIGAETVVYWRHAEDYNNSGVIEADEGNGQAIQFYSNDIYSNGITSPVIFALGQKLGKNTVIGGTSLVSGMTYAQLMQDIMDWFSWGQVEPDRGVYRGGWRYYPNHTSSDNSTAQWGSLPILYAASWGLQVPQYVKTELELWVNYIQNANGGSGYTTPDNYVNVSKTGGLLVELAAIGAPLGDTRVQNALGFIDGRWNNGPSGTWYGNLNHPYAMWAVYKALEVYGLTDHISSGSESILIGKDMPAAPGGFTIGQDWDPQTSIAGDWYSHYCQYLVNIQDAEDGSWSGYSYWTGALATGWYINILNAAGAPPPVNEPPIADAGLDQTTVECQGSDGTEVTLDGSGSSDPDEEDVLTYSWSLGGEEIATGVNPTVSLCCVGTYTITLTVDDGNEETDSDEVVITIVDTTPPEVTVDQIVTNLWPPNHKMHLVATVAASDVCGEAGDRLTLGIVVTSNQDINGQGDGDTEADWEIIDNGDGTYEVWLRAERSGKENEARIYTITATADDEYNETEAVAEVTVAHDQREDKGKKVKKLALPGEYALLQNTPNPFNPSTEITYALPELSYVRLTIYNLLGQEMVKLVDGEQPAGFHTVMWDASEMSGGMYLYRLEMGQFEDTKRMLLVK